MLPGFGFSPCNFVTGIHPVIKVAKALENSGGALKEQQSLIQELLKRQTLLRHLQNVSPNASSLNHINAVRGMAFIFNLLLSEFP